MEAPMKLIPLIVVILYVMCINTFVDSERLSERACTEYSKPSDGTILDKIQKPLAFNGEQAEAGEFPFMAALGYYRRDNKISFDCGSVIISKSYILTSAHCVSNAHRPVGVRLGILSLSDDDHSGMHYIKSIIRHPEFSPKTKKNDIALVELSNRINFTDTIKPVCLETDTSDIDSDVDLIVAGFGVVSEQAHRRTNTLLKAVFKTIPLSQCNSTFVEFNKDRKLAAFRDGISESQYSVRDPNAGRDSCQADSGGPLLKVNSDTTPTKLIGITSFGVACGTYLPGVYTRVASYVDWIESIVWSNGQIN